MIDPPDPAPPAPHLYRISPRTVLRLRGADRLRFLNGQVTQDVRLASTTDAVSSCVTNAKGQLEAVCHIREFEDSYLIDAPRDLREALFNRLDRYIIADDVELTDESELWNVAHIVGAEPPTNTIQWRAQRVETPGIDLFSRESIADLGMATSPEKALQDRCTFEGIPTWGTELTPGLLPPEAGLDQHAISYEKGCYIGQEVISRMKHAGKTNQHLVGLDVPAGLHTPSSLIHEGAEAGRITSVVETSDTTARALGFRKRKFATIDEFSLGGLNGATLPGSAKVRH